MKIAYFLQQSLLNALEKKSIDAILVREIIDDVGACKSTFYKYYQDKYALLFACFDTFFYKRDQGTPICDRYPSVEAFLRETLPEFSLRSRAAVNAFDSRDVNNVRKYHEQVLSELIAPDIFGCSLNDLNGENLRAVMLYAKSITFLTEEWILNDCEESVDALIAFIGSAKPALLVRDRA